MIAAADVTAAATVALRVGLIREEERMSFLTAQPEALTAVAGTLQGVGSAMRAQNAAAASTTGAMADDVAALSAAQFAAHAQLYQVVSAQAGITRWSRTR